MPYETIDDIELYYEVHGPSDAPPVIFIEGWGYSLWMWFRQIPVLKERYRCIVFDNRGVGRSSKPDYPYTMDMFAADTVGLMKSLDIETAHFLGISMGGFIAQQIAISYPEKVRSLILASTHFGGPNAIIANDRTMAMMFASPTETLSKEQATKMRYSVAFNPKYLEKNMLLLNQIQEWVEQYPQPLYARGNQAAASVAFDVEEEVKKISVPTLILHGDSDLIVPPQNAELLADKIPGSKLVFIKGGPHLSFIEHYGMFNSEVLSFLAEVEK
ncbi:alpha/beta fold hydrolase [Candidatus Thorarchaeota archaeon]|nr:MAG: alpha/beta fold hydrolase [Candidatus Thorarchaeota archaeon]